MALFLSIFPIILLIWLMVKKNSMPSYIALPITAALIYAIKLFYFKDDAMLLNATAASGLVSTLTPITVIFGAIMFNRMMETTGCIDIIRKWLATISPNPVAQLMIIGWSFAFYDCRGASGFGTPAAIAAPILMSLGFNPLKVAIFAGYELRTGIFRRGRYADLVRFRTVEPECRKHPCHRQTNRRDALLRRFRHSRHRLELHRALV